jgi:NTP pyrophosphatase (non-canonical NTP hydrolase)
MSIFEAIEQWADDRNLIKGSDPKSQFLKLMEEVGELAEGIRRGNLAEVQDGIGDVAVVLTILAAQHNLAFMDCANSAYNEIKDRKGRMVDGIFVKEGDE